MDNPHPQNLKQLDWSNIEQQHYLGKGGYSEVYKAKINGQWYAIKKIYSHLLKEPLYRQNVYRQIEIMKSIQHPNIVSFYGCIENELQLCLVLEFVLGGTIIHIQGNLYDQLRLYGKLSNDKVVAYIKDIVSALNYLHNQQVPILHRDIKPQNLLVGEDGHIKLADFGSANFLNGKRCTFVGTTQYMAPQIIEDQPHGVLIDIWCVGVLIYELLTGQLPTQPIIFPSYVSRPAEDVIKRLLQTDPIKRMTLEQLQNHIWFVWDTQHTKSYILYGHQHDNKSNKSVQIVVEKNKIIDTIKNNNINHHITTQAKLFQSDYIKQQSQQYIKHLKTKQQLKMQIALNQQLICQQQIQLQLQKPFLQKQMQRVTKQIEEYNRNIDILKDSELKFIVECSCLLERLDRKFKSLYEYATNLPRKIEIEVLEHNSVVERKLSSQGLPVSQYIYKYKIHMLQCRRDALIELLTAKKRAKHMTQLSSSFE